MAEDRRNLPLTVMKLFSPRGMKEPPRKQGVGLGAYMAWTATSEHPRTDSVSKTNALLPPTIFHDQIQSA